MKKYIETYKGKEYTIREVDLSSILEGYGVERIAGCELSQAMKEYVEDFNVEDIESTELDNSIYCYLDSGMIDADLTDAEILMEIVGMEGLTDQEWYNLMRCADAEISQLYADGKINMNVESYECGGSYSVYAYNDKVRENLYYGKSAEMAAKVIFTSLTTIRLMQG